jgi:competence protein ComEC
MLGVGIVTRLAQRPTSPWAVLAVGGVEPVFDSSVAADLGYQLSMIGVGALIAGAALVDRLALNRLPRWTRSIVAAVVGTTIATIASAPLVAWYFGRVSLIAPASNLAAGPLIALAQPMLFCGMVLAPLRPLALLIADATHPLLAGLDRVALWSAAVPYAAIQVAPTRLDGVLAAIACGAVLVACASREWPRAALVAIAAVAALAWRPLAPGPSSLAELHVIDVGQGDAIALRTPHGRWVLFDAGRAWAGGDAGRSTIIPYLHRRGGALAMFVLSHPHTDHVGGAASVLRALQPARYVDAGFPGGASAYRASLVAARDARVRWTRAHPNDSVVVDGVTITFLAPDSAWTASLADPNLASVVTLVRVGDVRFLLTGDAEGPEEDWLLANEGDRLRADVLKVAHHGSRTSSTAAFLAAVRPRLALVSVGAGNTYGHPSTSVLAALGNAATGGAQVLRTDQLGTIVARTDGQRIFLEAGGEKWELPRSPAP